MNTKNFLDASIDINTDLEELVDGLIVVDEEEGGVDHPSNWKRIIIAVDGDGKNIYLDELENRGYTLKEYLQDGDGLHDFELMNDGKLEQGVHECHIACDTTQDYSGDYDSTLRLVSSKLLFKLPEEQI